MSNDRFLCFSIGENCLTDDILDRNNLKSFSSPFASGRSNIEYLLNFEKENYAHFIDKNFLIYERLDNGKTVPRNKKYVSTQNKYNNSCTFGFEFTHHDVINNEETRQTFVRRCARISNLKNKNIVMLYHHRKCEQTDMGLLIRHLIDFSEIYESKRNKVDIFCFFQVIVSNKEERKVESYSIGNIHVYKFYTLNEWAGDDQDIFWARCDDDLLKTMIDNIKAKQRVNNKVFFERNITLFVIKTWERISSFFKSHIKKQ